MSPSSITPKLAAHRVSIIYTVMALAWVVTMGAWSYQIANTYVTCGVAIVAVGLFLAAIRRRRVITARCWLACRQQDRMYALMTFCLTHDIPFEIKYDKIGFIDESDLVRVNLSV